MAKLLLGVLAGIVLVYAALLVALYFGQRSLLYLPDTSRPQLGSLAELGFREVTLTTADGLSLLSWYRPPDGGAAPVVAYFHGNGGHIGYRTDRMIRFAQQGLGVLLLEYRGYGGNPGRPTEAGLYADAEAALDFLARQGIPANRLVLYGESLGSGVAAHLAAGREIGALILEAPFTRLADAASYHYPYVPVSLLLRDRFDSLAAIGHVRAPVLVLHGERDRVVPVRLGHALFAAAPEPKEGWFSPEAGHEDIRQFGGLDAAFDFIKRRIH